MQQVFLFVLPLITTHDVFLLSMLTRIGKMYGTMKVLPKEELHTYSLYFQKTKHLIKASTAKRFTPRAQITVDCLKLVSSG